MHPAYIKLLKCVREGKKWQDRQKEGGKERKNLGTYQ